MKRKIDPSKLLKPSNFYQVIFKQDALDKLSIKYAHLLHKDAQVNEGNITDVTSVKDLIFILRHCQLTKTNIKPMCTIVGNQLLKINDER